ncbi:NAD(P)/FAD-dependent oxidoreductase [Corynebacterium lowii]|nr:NAD(P)/FAD-dependent oxidoreductase [Corynebacterium lowii]MDP9851382.1 thioredoxin reductase [Corynebacterium lowii]
MNQEWDLIIIGGSAAGVAAALTAGRCLRRTLVVDAGTPRNRFAAHMHNTVGFDGKPPAEFVAAGRAEAQAYGVEFLSGTVTRLREEGTGLEVTIDVAGEGSADGRAGARVLRARRVLLATGASDDLPAIPGVERFWGKSVLHCPYCHGYEVANQRLGVIATSPMSAHQATLLTQWTKKLTVFTQGVELAGMERLRANGVRIVESPVISLKSENERLAGVRTQEGEYPVDAVFLGSTLRLNIGFAEELNLATKETPMGVVLDVDHAGATSHPKVWAAGNVSNPGATVPVAAAAGSQAAAVINMSLVEEDLEG